MCMQWAGAVEAAAPAPVGSDFVVVECKHLEVAAPIVVEDRA